MNASNQSENIYISELKSLLKDKFFMLLLGISVAIVLMSTLYSIVRPKTNGEVASGPVAVTGPAQAQNQEAGNGVAFDESSDIQGLEAVSGLNEVTPAPSPRSLLQALKDTAQSILGSASPSPTPTVTTEVESEAQTQTPRKGESYTVQEGDTLWMIAERVYSSGYNFVDIAEANSLMNPDFIMTGQEISLPVVDAKEPTVGDITPDATMTRSTSSVKPTHTVVEGESLWTIAQAEYNDPYMWTQIVSLNPSITNPDIIYPTTVLKLK